MIVETRVQDGVAIVTVNNPPVNELSTGVPEGISMGEHAHSRVFSEQAFKLASEPKELYIVPNAGHVDLYDNIHVIPWDKLNTFFSENLK